MKLTKSKLKQIIKEELKKLTENYKLTGKTGWVYKEQWEKAGDEGAVKVNFVRPSSLNIDNYMKVTVNTTPDAKKALDTFKTKPTAPRSINKKYLNI